MDVWVCWCLGAEKDFENYNRLCDISVTGRRGKGRAARETERAAVEALLQGQVCDWSKERLTQMLQSNGRASGRE